MIINIMDYVDRYLNDYIVYYYWHFYEKYGDLDKARLYFDMKYQQERTQMVEDARIGQFQSQIAKLREESQKSGDAIRMFGSMSQPGTLEGIIDQIGNALENAVDIYYDTTQQKEYEQIIAEAKGFSSQLAKGRISVQGLNDFFLLIVDALEQIGKIDANLFVQLTDIGKKLAGTEFELSNAITSRNVSATVEKEDLDRAQKIVDTLNRAVARFEATSYVNGSGNTVSKAANTLSRESFQGTITHIFSTLIGEPMARQIVAQGLQMAMQQADSEFAKMMKSLNGKLTFVSGDWDLGGTSRDVSNTVSKVDLFNQNAFQLSVTIDGQNYDIDIGANTSVKWYSGGVKKGSSIRLVAGTPVGKYFKEGTLEHYLAYNVIAHKGHGADFDEAYRVLRASTAATFFNQWMSGTGAAVGSGGNLNRVQFLMINGKFYSVMRIIRNICDELMQKNSWNAAGGPFDIGMNGGPVQNKWYGSHASNIPDAMVRSKLVNEVISKLTISATLNDNILLKYALPTNQLNGI